MSNDSPNRPLTELEQLEELEALKRKLAELTEGSGDVTVSGLGHVYEDEVPRLVWDGNGMIWLDPMFAPFTVGEE